MTPSIAELLAQERLHDRRRQRRRPLFVERRHEHVRGHDERHAARGSRRGTARTRRRAADRADARRAAARRASRRSCRRDPGKCLPQAATPSPCSARMIAAPRRATSLGPLGQRAIADDGILRVGVDVEHGRVVERDADRRQLARQRAARTAPPAPRSPARPSTAIGGHRVNGSFSRATRPPS